MYEPGPGAQIHDLNPGIKADGLFWTIAIPDEGIEVHLGKGFASMEATHVLSATMGTSGMSSPLRQSLQVRHQESYRSPSSGVA